MTKINEMMTAKMLEGFGEVNRHGKTATLEYLNMLTQLTEYTCDESALVAELEAKERRINPADDDGGAMAKYYKHIDPNTILDMTVMLGKVPCLEVIHGDNARHKFPLAEGWQIYICNEFLRSLDLEYYISFEDFMQYDELVNMCMEQLQGRK